MRGGPLMNAFSLLVTVAIAGLTVINFLAFVTIAMVANVAFAVILARTSGRTCGILGASMNLLAFLAIIDR